MVIGKNVIFNMGDGEIVIGDDCVIVDNPRWNVLKGVKIHGGAIFGADSVVNRAVEPNSIVAGSPVQVIGARK